MRYFEVPLDYFLSFLRQKGFKMQISKIELLHDRVRIHFEFDEPLISQYYSTLQYLYHYSRFRELANECLTLLKSLNKEERKKRVLGLVEKALDTRVLFQLPLKRIEDIEFVLQFKCFISERFGRRECYVKDDGIYKPVGLRLSYIGSLREGLPSSIIKRYPEVFTVKRLTKYDWAYFTNRETMIRLLEMIPTLPYQDLLKIKRRLDKKIPLRELEAWVISKGLG